MAIEVKIPKEINTYEAKFIGPFTMRQSVALLIALPACIVVYNFLKEYMSTDVVVFFLMIPAGVAYLFGWCKPYGMKFEKFLSNVFISAFVAPSKRKYVTNNYYSTLAKKIREEEKIERQEKGGGSSKKKYRRSKDAIK